MQIDELLKLKADYKELTGTDPPAPTKEPSKKKAPASSEVRGRHEFLGVHAAY